MTRRRSLLLLAMLTALIGAPSVALAAPPNQLLAPAATPTSGTTATVFVLSVTYLSAGGNAATAVTATVAGGTLAMSRTAGSASDGVWTTSTSLPAGTWPVTFQATATKGPEPSVGGVTVSVASIVPHPTPEGPDPTPSTDVAEDDGTPTPTPTPVTAPSSASATSSTPPDEVAGSPAPSSAVSPATPDGGAGAGGSSDGGGVTAPTAGDAAGPGDPNAPASPVASSAAPGAPSTGGAREDGTSELLPIDSPMIWSIMVGGLVGVAAVALLGSAWLFLRRPRSDDREPVAVTEGPPGIMSAAPSARSRRRAALREASEDPVLAAMGLDQPVSDPPRASQVHRGTAMRDASRPRPRR